MSIAILKQTCYSVAYSPRTRILEIEESPRQPIMSYSELYRGGEPNRWRTYDSSNYDSYRRPYDSARHETASLVPVRVIERGHVDPDRALREKKTATFWDRSDNCLNYVVYPGADDYHSPTSSSYDYYGRSATDDYSNYGTESYDYRGGPSSLDDHNSYSRSAAYDYSYSSSPDYSRHYDHSDKYPSSTEYSRHNVDQHYRSKSYDAYRYR